VFFIDVWYGWYGVWVDDVDVVEGYDFSFGVGACV